MLPTASCAIPVHQGFLSLFVAHDQQVQRPEYLQRALVVALELIEGLSVVRGGYYSPWRQVIPVEVGNGPDVANVIENDVILALARLRVLHLFLELRRAWVILERTEVEASVAYLAVRAVLVQGTAAALASIFCMLGSARGAWKLFVLDGAEVPEQQGVPARGQVVSAEVGELNDVHF